MTFLDALVRSASAKALGYTLLHSLWEGAVIALIVAIILSVARSSRIRYAAACLAMLALLAGFGATFYRLLPREDSVTRKIQIARPAFKPLPPDHLVQNAAAPWDASELLPWLAPFWIAGVLLFQLRCLISWVAAGRFQRNGVYEVSEEWMERLNALRTRLLLTRRVALLESCLAEVPVVIGHLKPVILMPVGLLAGLPVGQIEAILLHELAHIRRGDYLINLMQAVVEGLLFYHPAVWWISRVIRTERENCCDDLVIATRGNAHEYATALAAIAENRWTMRETALAATGGNLVKRVQRLLGQSEEPRPSITPALSAGLLVVTCAVALAAWQAPSQNPPMIVPVIPVASAPSVKLRIPFAAQVQSAAKPASTPYDKWLAEEAIYIITDQERAAYRGLQTDAERQQFIKQFWERRDPTPGTSENEFQNEHYRRVAYANERFAAKTVPGWKTDRGRIYIQYGPPDEIESHPSGGAYTRPAEQGGGQTSTYPFEDWRYRYIEGIGTNVILAFVDRTMTGEYRLTLDPTEKELLVLSPIQRQLENLENNLRSINDRLISGSTQKDLLEARARVMLAQKQIENAEKELLKAQAQTTPAENDLAMSERRLARLESALTALAAKAPLEITFFRSSGPTGYQAIVKITDKHTMLVTIPIEFEARQYLITSSTVSADQTTNFGTSQTLANSCKATPTQPGCVEESSHTTGTVTLPPGSYIFTAKVKDTASSAQKTYVVNFSVH